MTDWECPNCHLQKRTQGPLPSSPFHNCSSLYGLTAPLLRLGVKAKVTAHEREDYVGHDDVQLDNRGRPVMSVVTTRDNGMDTAVFVPTAHITSRI